ncbi:hypothetical protein L6164_024984 [Bauhinia variegata]|uniref:Uncharacterized protein n=1 Tax=Bauhinia variegata TaxID=167791 RepID=A0ACB9M0T7_BAUVA|nr:hypothetical protein L6164_024984 [Bauhinia variegata]
MAKTVMYLRFRYPQLWSSATVNQLASNPTSHERSKHVDIDCHFIWQYVTSGFLKLVHVKNQHQLATYSQNPCLQPSSILSKLGVLSIFLSN